MRDLACFRLLLERRWEDPALPEMLESLAKLGMRQRVPFFGPLLDLLGDEAPAAKTLHARALACVDGADGHLLVVAIDSLLEEEASREAAVAALRRVATRQPNRWVHALFHREADVRRLALAERAPGDAASFEIFALADPAAREAVLARTASCGAEGIGAVLDFLASGVIDAARARTLLPLAETIEWIARARRRSEVSLAALGAWVRDPARYDPNALDEERDDLDALIELFWDDEHAARVFPLVAGNAELQNRAILSVLAVAARRGAWSGAALALLFSLFPGMIGWRFLDERLRREAVERTLALRASLRRASPVWLQPFFFEAMCLHEDGGADLRVLGAIQSLSTSGEPAKLVGQWIGEDVLVASIEARPAEAVAFFQLADKDDLYKMAIYGKLSPRARDALVAAFAREAPEPALPFLARVEGGRLAVALAELVNVALPSARARSLAEILAQRADGVFLNDLFFRWRPRLPAGEDDANVQLGFALFFAAARVLEVERFLDATTRNARTLPVLLGVIDESTSFPYGKEMALAAALRESPDPFVRRWALARVRPPEPPPAVAAPPPDDALARVIVTCKRADLPKLVAPFVRGGRKGLAAALAHRTDNPASDAHVAAALLASNDPLEAVDAQLARYGGEDDAFLREVERLLVAEHDRGGGALSLLGHAALWRFERHGRAFLDAALARWGDLPGIARGALVFAWPTSRRVVLQALADSVAVMGARDKPLAAKLVGAPLIDALADALATESAPWAADALLATFRSAPALLPPAEGRLRARLVDTDAVTREKLGGWIDMVGVPARAPVAPRPAESDEHTIARVRACTDVAELGRFCADPRAAIVHEATLRLLELGETGRAELARILETAGEEAEIGPIAESLPLWDEGESLARARDAARDPSRPPHVRFAIALGLLERKELDFEPLAVETLAAPRDRAWFRPEHWAKLASLVDPTALAITVATSSQPHAYIAAVQHLLARGEGDACVGALRAFLEQGTHRMGALRRSAAEWLAARGDFTGFPLLLEQGLETTQGTSTLLVGAPPALVRAATLAFLRAGNGLAKESALLFHLAPAGVDWNAKDEAYETILLHCASDPIRQRAANAIRSGLRRLHKLMRVAETFAWGARMGQELLGRLYRVQMTGGKSLGHTFLKERKIHVTPLPILRGERHGREIVEALILHEYGHHLYHRGPNDGAVWNQAEREGIHDLLNLVADEHLERNLRAMDPSFGDRLKRLAAYAFQHTEREIAVRALLGHLGGHAFGVLTKTRLGVARGPDRVVVDSGEILFAMEHEAMAFSRFVRALRMGLGNRHDDPIVARGLALFEGDFRRKSMPELLAVAHQLRDIFGWQVELAKSLGPHESLEEQPRSEDIIWGDGITQEEIDRMVERVLDPKHREGPPPPEGSMLRPVLNMSPKNDFDRITHVERMPFDATAHRDYARKVARPASLMRRYLEELGLHHVPQHARLRGSRFDKSRVLPLVIRNEPRVLLQRELESRTDLFLGVVIDCSGSMASRDNMERARQFGMLLAEACNGLSGVDLRVFGFTDKVIYDCGDARRCSAYALRASGGNNDAAALFHVANVARASRRRAKLLVMISDGLPTECTVAALRELVQTLGRRYKMVCAQVAVQPLAEVCFPNYVVCNDPTVEQTVSRFGRIIAGLVRKTLSS